MNRLSTVPFVLCTTVSVSGRKAQRVLGDVAEVEDERRILAASECAGVDERPELELLVAAESRDPRAAALSRIDRQRRPVGWLRIVQSNWLVVRPPRSSGQQREPEHGLVRLGARAGERGERIDAAALELNASPTRRLHVGLPCERRRAIRLEQRWPSNNEPRSVCPYAGMLL